MATVLITGCSSGFGLLTAVELARRGDRVFASMRDPSRAGALHTALADAGVDATVVQLDVLDDASVAAAVAAVLEAAGGLDVLVNNAGVGYVGPLEEMTPEQIGHMFGTNIGGMIRVTKAVLPHMRAAGHGHIVNVTSIAAFLSVPFMGAYAATKHAVDALGEALAGEVAPLGIHVTNVAPGAYNTPMVEGVAAALAAAEGSAYAERFRTAVERHEAMMRAADTPEDVAVAIADAIHTDPPPARVVVPAESAGFVSARGTMPPEQLRDILRQTYGV
jgi:NAD(P)-dependent dehydrogenase (short-subunit alcohol dehydrogenase family)